MASVDDKWYGLRPHILCCSAAETKPFQCQVVLHVRKLQALLLVWCSISSLNGPAKTLYVFGWLLNPLLRVFLQSIQCASWFEVGGASEHHAANALRWSFHEPQPCPRGFHLVEDHLYFSLGFRGSTTADVEWWVLSYLWLYSRFFNCVVVNFFKPPLRRGFDDQPMARLWSTVLPQFHEWNVVPCFRWRRSARDNGIEPTADFLIGFLFSLSQYVFAYSLDLSERIVLQELEEMLCF